LSALAPYAKLLHAITTLVFFRYTNHYGVNSPQLLSSKQLTNWCTSITN